MEPLITPESIAEWKRRRRGLPQPKKFKNLEPLTHDTVAVLTCDAAGRLAGACSTSGLSRKMPGRVGDSPLVGTGLYVDDAAGAAASTGVGEEVVRAGGVVLIVELMRQGRSPQEACKAMIARINAISARRGMRPAEIGVLALNSQGTIGAASTAPTNFIYAIGRAGKVSQRTGAKISRGIAGVHKHKPEA